METNYPLILLLVWNASVFFLYAMDKLRAKTAGWRVRERTLLLCGFLGGGIGAMTGMLLLRHKTRHLRFRLLLPLAALLTLAVLAVLAWPQAVAEVVAVWRAR